MSRAAGRTRAAKGTAERHQPYFQHGKDDSPRLYGHSDRGYIAYG